MTPSARIYVIEKRDNCMHSSEMICAYGVAMDVKPPCTNGMLSSLDASFVFVRARVCYYVLSMSEGVIWNLDVYSDTISVAEVVLSTRSRA